RLLLAASPYIVTAAALMTYNYVRFENPFEFGQTYQLTVVDQTKTPGLLITMKDKSEKIIQKDSCSDQHSVDLPIAVLVDEYSASSSEIFAGALRDHKKAILVGVKTYGKGIVQVVYPLGDGSAVKLTIAAYFLPSGTSVHGDGLVPDAEIEMDMELRRQINLPHNQDVQLQRAITELGGEPLP
ncbi:MAG: hypothetical protein IKN79_00015, partial [Eubacterium sp.]|nr:hypothetical protein [Eubacterium sp.]